jgi:hypothetical protein
MAVLTAARIGVARVGGTRLGYPIAQGVVLPTYALLGVARLGATRLNWHSPNVFVAINGVHVGTARDVDTAKVRYGTPTITGSLGATPSTAACTTQGFRPVEGHEVIITLGSKNNLRREFAGQILSSTRGYVGTPENFHDQLRLIDYTWGLNKRKVRNRYLSTTVAAVAADLLANAPGYTLSVAADIGAERLDEITFTEQDLTVCLSQLVTRVGGEWVCDYHKVVRLFYEDATQTAPTILNAVHTSLANVSVTRDLSQVLTRVYVEGGGVNVAASLAVGETILPLDGDPAWYQAGGGVVVCGPQRITYTGVSGGSGGGLVGTGASPSGSPVGALTSGAGIETGAHQYTVTFVTAAGESISGPVATITTGVTVEPLTAPTTGAPTIGTGPNPGSHDYAVSFVTASGETLPGPRATQATALSAEPAAAPTVNTPTLGAGVTDGQHEYAVTNVTAIGETTPGPISAQVTAGSLPGPATAPTLGAGTPGTGPDAGVHEYAVTFVTALGETTAGARVTAANLFAVPPATAPSASNPMSGIGPEPGTYDYLATFVTPSGETTAGPAGTGSTSLSAAPTTAPAAGSPAVGVGIENGTVDYVVTFGASGDSQYAARETTASAVSNAVTCGVQLLPVATTDLWPTFRAEAIGGSGGGLSGIYQYAFTRVTAFGETTANPSTGTTSSVVTGYFVTIPSAPAGCTATNLYRTVGNGSQLKLAATLPVAGGMTFYADTLPDASLGAAPPTTNTANVAHNQVVVTLPSSPDPYVTIRGLYRRFNGAGPFLRVATLGNSWPPTYTDAVSNASLGAAPPTVNTAYLQQLQVSTSVGEAQVTARRIYRRTSGVGTFKLAGTVYNNAATAWTDTTPNASLGAEPPTVNTASLQRTIPLTAIPTGPSGTTARKLYRTAAGASQLKLLATLSGNYTTTATDATPDAGLGADAPTVGTAAANVIALADIPTGDSTVTSRNLYRRSGGLGLKFLATLPGNSSHTYTDTTPNAGLGAAVPVASTAYVQRIALTAIPKGGALVTARKVYRTAAGGSQLKLLTTLADNTTTAFADWTTDAALGANAPTVNTATANRVALTSIPVGAAAVTSRKVYRTVAGGSQLKLLTTLADNVTNVYADSAADATLGANVPTSDTSGLTQPQGNVLAGSTSLQIASIGAFPPQGWAVIGNGQQVIRYTSIAGNVLTGIPASGDGAILASITFNSSVTAAPALTGIPASGPGSIRFRCLKGDGVNLWARVDDVPAQTALAAVIGGDGIQEDTLQDRRLSYTEAVARGQAWLALKRDVEISLRYSTRDLNARVGRTQAVNLGEPFNVVADFMIQTVTESAFMANLMPTFDVTACSVRYSFDEFLRQIKKAA